MDNVQVVNRKIKIGDKVVCIKDFHSEGKQIFIANRFYFVREFENYKNYDLVKIDNTWFDFDKITELDFGTFFKTLGEYREKRIDEILELE